MSAVQRPSNNEAQMGGRPPYPFARLDALPPTAHKILRAATRLALKDGYGAVTFGAIAQKVHITKSTVAYHFGDKDALMTALLESLIHEWAEDMVRLESEIQIPQERLHSLLLQQRESAKTRDYWRLIFALMPEAARNKRRRENLQSLIRWYFTVDLRHLGLEEEMASHPEVELFISLLVAMVEGVAFQREVFGSEYDIDARFELWERILTPFFTQWTSFGATGPEADSGGDLS